MTRNRENEGEEYRIFKRITGTPPDTVCCASVSLGGALSSLLLQEYKTVVPKEVADQDELLQQKSVLIPVSVDSETASETEDEADCKHEQVAIANNAQEAVQADLTNNEGTATSTKKISSGLTAAVKQVVKNC